MPQKKKTTYKKSSFGKTPAKKQPVKKQSAKKQPAKKSAAKQELSSLHYVLPWVLAVVAIFCAICLFFTEYSGFVGKWLHDLFLGLFSGAGYALPFILAVIAFFWKADAKNCYTGLRITFAAVIMISLSSLIHATSDMTETFALKELWTAGLELNGGGAIGGLIGSALFAAIGKPGLIIVAVLLFVIFVIFFIGFTPGMVAKYISCYVKEKKASYDENRKIRAQYRDKPEVYLPEEDDYTPEPTNIIEMNEPIDDTPKVDPEIFERIKNEINATLDENNTPAKPNVITNPTPDPDNLLLDGETIKLIDSLGQDTELTPELERIPIEDPVEEKPPVKEKPKYIFPPISLLSQADKPQNEDVTDELRTNANKLVETLSSFRVRTKIIDISRGPAITRYELQPEEGVRVRQIASLVDDIALNLAAEGVRIEAPIPGKAAVGIEVPNKVRSNVGLREQLESPEFKNAKSRLTASLGVDVAGKPVYMDIAKMPHMLVAGATGQGKSVCINSIIVSILYKATPDEVKFILIDPKKVEFVPYNGLPHLLVPVVTDPKKAAGSLQWAVGEMERRYQLMETLGVRDIHNFNMKTKDDPTYEFIPQVVIIIDELADLMMTAPDQVEDSICRLAQKARAAGMHLILGTQRPSVDVVTGLIKANIPSRIACKTTSQVDSRTILDMVGAEKLIGRGDMLYSPVGTPKPMRVQGSFVHEDDVAKVTDFIRTKMGETEYDNSVIEQIEHEAAKCGKKGSGGVGASGIDDDDDSDPMLRQAIELAVESGKISTSLIQRKLSLGYGRAAKLIDTMEKMGIVGAPEGNKPRQVLMTQAEYAEMTMSQE